MWGVVLSGVGLGILGWAMSRSKKPAAGGSAPSSGGSSSGAGGLPPVPTRRPGWYGAKWKTSRPPELPANAFTTGDTGGARNYGLALARRLGGEPLWIATVDRLGKKESGWTVGLPAHVFGGNQRSWGAFQYLTSAVEAEPFFGEWRTVAPWYHPVEVELGAPIARYRDQWNEAARRSRDPGAPIAGAFLWQAAPAWRRRYWAALEEGASWQNALVSATSPKPQYYDTIARYVNQVLAAV